MTRLVSIAPSERDGVLAHVQQHLDEGGQLIELPKFVMHAMAGACPARSLPRFRSWLTSNAMTAALGETDVDLGRLVDRLNSVRVSLAATLAAQAAMGEKRAIEHAGHKVNSRAARDRFAFSGFPNVDAVRRTGGPETLLKGAWTTAEAEMTKAVTDAARDKATILREVLPAEQVDILVDKYQKRGAEAVATIIAAMALRAGRTIQGETRGLMQMAPVIRAATGYTEGARSSTDVNLDRAQPMVPPDVSAAVTASAETRLSWLWVHGFYGFPQQPFDPHVEIDQGVYSTGDLEGLEWFPGDHVGCFPAGTLVSAPEIRGATLRWYEGPLVKVTFASGQFLTATPNHPILTPHGWVGAGLLDEGRDVVRSSDREAIARLIPSDHHVPTPIEEVVAALGEHGRVLPTAVPIAAEDFHGDGAGSEVAVVWADSNLWHRVNTSLDQPFSQLALSDTALASSLPTKGRPASLVEGRLAAAGSSVGGPRVGAALLVRHPDVASKHGVGGVSEPDAGQTQSSSDGAAVDANRPSNLIRSLAGLVTMDQVVDVERFDAACHVYNLHTATGWYVADGIVVHNCTCETLPQVEPF